MFKKIELLIIASFLFTFVSACNLGSVAPTAGGDSSGGSPTHRLTRTPRSTRTSTSTATRMPKPTRTPSAIATRTHRSTRTPGAVGITVSVSVDTNCRVGPGSMYDMVGGLDVGETAEVVGKDAFGQYWIISDAGVPGGTCWIWGQYATVSGDTSGLPVIEPPPTPTLAIILAPPVGPSASITIVNNSSTTICFLYISLHSSSNWGADQLGSTYIVAGASYTVTVSPGVYDVKIEDSAQNVLTYWLNLAVNGPYTVTYP
jgi:hypothetical protein